MVNLLIVTILTTYFYVNLLFSCQVNKSFEIQVLVLYFFGFKNNF